MLCSIQDIISLLPRFGCYLYIGIPFVFVWKQCLISNIFVTQAIYNELVTKTIWSTTLWFLKTESLTPTIPYINVNVLDYKLRISLNANLIQYGYIYIYWVGELFLCIFLCKLFFFPAYKTEKKYNLAQSTLNLSLTFPLGIRCRHYFGESHPVTGMVIFHPLGAISLEKANCTASLFLLVYGSKHLLPSIFTGFSIKIEARYLNFNMKYVFVNFDSLKGFLCRYINL